MADVEIFQPKMGLCAYRHNPELGECNSLIYQTRSGEWYHVEDEEGHTHKATPQLISEKDNH
jgi:hypothetical protein